LILEKKDSWKQTLTFDKISHLNITFKDWPRKWCLVESKHWYLTILVIQK